MVDTSGQRSKPVCTIMLWGSSRFYSGPWVLFCSWSLLLRSTALKNKTCSNTKRHKTLALIWTLFKWWGNHNVSLFKVDIFSFSWRLRLTLSSPMKRLIAVSLWRWPVSHVFNWLKMGQINTPTDSTCVPSKLGEFRGGLNIYSSTFIHL